MLALAGIAPILLAGLYGVRCQSLLESAFARRKSGTRRGKSSRTPIQTELFSTPHDNGKPNNGRRIQSIYGEVWTFVWTSRSILESLFVEVRLLSSTMSKHVRSVDTESSASAYFAPATIGNGQEVIHVSGQIGATSDGSVPSDYGSQIHLALLNVRKALAASGASVPDIVKLALYIVNYSPDRRLHAPIVQKFLAGHRPAMTLVPVQQLAGKGWLVEIDAVAIRPTPKLAKSFHKSASTNVDVVVIGAGLAGLAAAHEVIRAGHSCILLEARDRVGGRTLTHKLQSQDGYVDLGAAWINDTNQIHMIALAKRYGAELLEQSTNGTCVLQNHDGTLMHFPYGELPGVSVVL